MRRGLAVLLLFGSSVVFGTLAGCANDEDPPSPADAGVPDTGADHADAGPTLLDRLEPPLPPADPALTPCPEGWVETELTRRDGTVFTVCDPQPASPATCPSDQALFPGEPGCVTVGPPCPQGDWAEELPEPGPDLKLLFVKPGAANGDGTRQRPFGTIDAAIGARGPTPAAIALAKGRYEESLDFPRNVSVIGACTGETLLTEPTAGLGYGVVNATFPGASISNVRLLAERPGAWSLEQGELELNNVIVESASSYGLMVTRGGKMRGRNVVIRSVMPSNEQPLTVGVLGLEGTIELDRVQIEGVPSFAVFAQLATTVVRLKNTAIRDLPARPNTNRLGRAVHVVGEASVFLESSLIERAKDSGISVAELGSLVTLTDVVIRDTEGNGENTGTAIQASEGGRVNGTRVWIERARASSIHAEKGGELHLDHLVMREVLSDPETRETGRHVNLIEGGRAVLRFVYASRALESTIAADGPGTRLLLEDARLEDNAGRETDGTSGSGIQLQTAASATVTRTVVEGVRRSGVLANEATLLASDLVVRDMGSDLSDGQAGMALMSQDGAFVDASRVLIERGRFYGAYASGGTLIVRDIVVRETQSVEMPIDVEQSSDFGMGIVVTSGELVVERALVEDNRAAGIAASGANSRAVVNDVLVRNTIADSRGLFGEGIYVERGARLELRNALVDNNRELGVYANLGAHVVLEDVEVRGTAGNIEGVAGYGIYALQGGTMELARTKSIANTVFGVVAQSEGSSITARELEARDTRRSSDGGLIKVDGTGIAALDGGYVRAEDFVVADNKLCGVMIAGGEMDLSRGVVSNSLIGANVRAEGFSLERLMDQVRYEDNVTNLDSTELALPALDPPELSFPAGGP
jgi:hypothetical protein